MCLLNHYRPGSLVAGNTTIDLSVSLGPSTIVGTYTGLDEATANANIVLDVLTVGTPIYAFRRNGGGR